MLKIMLCDDSFGRLSEITVDAGKTERSRGEGRSRQTFSDIKKQSGRPVAFGFVQGILSSRFLHS